MTDDPLAGLMSFEGVPSAFAAVRDGIDALLRDRGLRRTSPELTAESLLLGAHASAVLEGSGATLDQLREEPPDAAAVAALRVSTEVLALVPVLAHSPLQAFARLHTLAAKGVVPDSELGRPTDRAAADRLSALGGLLLGRSSAPA